MITIVFFVVVCLTAVGGGALVLAEAADPWFQRQKRRVKRSLMAKWLAEDGLTAVPREQIAKPEAFDIDEMVALINRF